MMATLSIPSYLLFSSVLGGSLHSSEKTHVKISATATPAAATISSWREKGNWRREGERERGREEREDMEFDEHDDQDEEMEIPVHHHQAAPAPVGYDSLGNPGRPSGSGAVGEGGASAAPRKSASASVRYRECLKNHAVGIGGSAVDGCGEFMAAGEEGTLDALKCAACNCHRNFHRKETDAGDGGGGLVSYHHPHHHPGQQHPQFSPYYRAAPSPAGYLHLTPPQQQHRPLALPAASGGGHSREELEDMSNPSSSGGGGGGGGSGLKKRFRTKFTPEQKEKMLGFAERLGWRIQKHDETAVEQFCAETGVKRHVLKVWMHNNKHTLGKKP
ncbi:hypothetical protein EUGRSUZ_F00403 [Eucalyptus grandis]|uniref:ZF-HD dimerization-type domain-containing protein n=2 Tax=Eucalyptus grandis TaxID=71139 RepID=A0A059BKP6_EUCGR|nr:hypothetical protein EUGRSUZ_F00403 [Eucalyptus grandis]